MASFEHLVRELLKATTRVDRSLLRLQRRADEVKQKYEPRQEFERWKQTIGGRRWKKQQHEQQRGLCAVCQQPVSLKGAHIDHIKPLSAYPDLAIAPDNLRILCADCNLSKGAKEAPNS